MTVLELIEALEDFGDHLHVVVVVERGNHDVVGQGIEVDTMTHDGETVVELRTLVA